MCNVREAGTALLGPFQQIEKVYQQSGKKHRDVQCHDAIEKNGQSPFITPPVLHA